MKQWLRQPAGPEYAQTGSIQGYISAVMFDAASYLKYGTSDFLSIMGNEVTLLTYTNVPDIPQCADPRALWGQISLGQGQFLGDADNASNDAEGTSQATSDCRAVIADFGKLKAELDVTAPGSGIKGLTATP